MILNVQKNIGLKIAKILVKKEYGKEGKLRYQIPRYSTQ